MHGWDWLLKVDWVSEIKCIPPLLQSPSSWWCWSHIYALNQLWLQWSPEKMLYFWCLGSLFCCSTSFMVESTIMVTPPSQGYCKCPLIVLVCLFPLSACPSVWQREGCWEGDCHHLCLVSVFVMNFQFIQYELICMHFCVLFFFITMNTHCTCVAVVLYFRMYVYMSIFCLLLVF